MKYLIILFVALNIFSCNQGIKKRKMFIHSSNDNNWSTSILYCDSAYMESPNKVIAFVDGTKTIIYAKDILIGSSDNF